jgi:hypothetical protein
MWANIKRQPSRLQQHCYIKITQKNNHLEKSPYNIDLKGK